LLRSFELVCCTAGPSHPAAQLRKRDTPPTSYTSSSHASLPPLPPASRIPESPQRDGALPARERARAAERAAASCSGCSLSSAPINLSPSVGAITSRPLQSTSRPLWVQSPLALCNQPLALCGCNHLSPSAINLSPSSFVGATGGAECFFFGQTACPTGSSSMPKKTTLQPTHCMSASLLAGQFRKTE